MLVGIQTVETILSHVTILWIFWFSDTPNNLYDFESNFRRPKAPAFIFLSPLESNWESLRSIIPNMLQLSVVGYPFVNPGPVGGAGKSTFTF